MAVTVTAVSHANEEGTSKIAGSYFHSLTKSCLESFQINCQIQFIADHAPDAAGPLRLSPLLGLPPPHAEQAAPPLRRQVGRRGRPQAQGLPQGAQEGQEKGKYSK